MSDDTVLTEVSFTSLNRQMGVVILINKGGVSTLIKTQRFNHRSQDPLALTLMFHLDQ
jgi:hypothetical protein